MASECRKYKLLTDADVKRILLEEGITDDAENYDGIFHINHDIYTHVCHCSMLMKMQHLDLSHNQIMCSKGLEFCSSLITLNMEHNQLTSMNHLTDMKYLKVLNLQHNKISAIEYLGNSPSLEVLNLSDNVLGSRNGGCCSLYNLMHNYKLQVLNLKNNQIDEEVLGDFVQFPGLRQLIFTPNPVVSHYPAYRATFVFFLTQVDILDGEKITEDEYKIATVRVWEGPEAAERERRRLERIRRGEPEESLLSNALYIVTTPFRIIPMLLNPFKLIRWVCGLFRK